MTINDPSTLLGEIIFKDVNMEWRARINVHIQTPHYRKHIGRNTNNQIPVWQIYSPQSRTITFRRLDGWILEISQLNEDNEEIWIFTIY